MSPLYLLSELGIIKNKAKAIQVCINRFDDETKQSFLELYDKVDADVDLEAAEDRMYEDEKTVIDTFSSPVN